MQWGAKGASKGLHPAEVCLCCHHNIAQAGCLPQQRLVFSRLCRLEVPDRGLALVSGESCLPGLQMAPALCVLTWPSLGVSSGRE